MLHDIVLRPSTTLLWASSVAIDFEVCRRLNLTIVGSRVGEEFLIWPQKGNPEACNSFLTESLTEFAAVTLFLLLIAVVFAQQKLLGKLD
ncbi:hypothetical protein U1Q18_000417 [Sarracenia purpurea var. burkii]